MVSKGKTGIQEVAPGIWADILSATGPNAGFILAGDKTIVVDALVSLGAAREMLAGIKKAGGKEPSFLINTHGDGDHIIGNQIFAPPAVVIAQENTHEAIMKEGAAAIKRTAQIRPDLAEELKEVTIVIPEITFCHAMSLNFGSLSINLIYLGPAHTFGDSVIYIPEEQVLFAGDLMFNHIIPVIKGDSANWVRALIWLEKLDIKAVIPGHGYVGTKEDLVALRKFLQKLRREVKRCYDKGVPEDKAVTEINLGKYRDWLRQERVSVDVAKLYKEFSGTS
ncbi:MBL fold metallo-hydrolase [Chloroflexota bacterium]